MRKRESLIEREYEMERMSGRKKDRERGERKKKRE